MIILERVLDDSDATEALGAALARCAGTAGLLLFLHGDLGAGKTTLVRGYLRGRDHGGTVKSPTYTIVEPYALAGGPVYHFDLYRLGDPEELEFLGLRDYLAADAQCLIEWPEQGRGLLPPADIDITLSLHAKGRLARLSGHSPRAAAVLRCLDNPTANG